MVELLAMHPRAAILALLLGTYIAGHAAEIREVPALAKAFEAENTTGTFVLFDPETDTYLVHDADRAKQRFVPASTFKIVNALIGLETAAVRDVDEILPYGGKPVLVPEWAKDMSLRDGIRVSNVPVFQELARRIGQKRMAEKVKAWKYGNGDIGQVVDRFWLEGPLKISAIEQAEFLSRLIQRKLPVAEKNVAAVEEITLFEKTDTYRIHAKTGWEPPIGWWVGWIQQKEKLYTFALNIEFTEMKDAPKRIAIGKACLRILGKLE